MNRPKSYILDEYMYHFKFESNKKLAFMFYVRPWYFPYYGIHTCDKVKSVQCSSFSAL